MPTDNDDKKVIVDDKKKVDSGGAADDKGDDDAGGAGDDKDTVSRAEFNKVMAELHKHKKTAKELEREKSDAKTKQMKDEAKWQELAEANENKAKEATERADRLQNSYLGEKKFSAIQSECQKLGLRPEAVSDLEALDFDDIQVETTSTGKINILGASKFAQRLKTQKPHWFQDGKASKLNTGGGRVLDSGSDDLITPSQIYEAEKAGRKSGDMKSYNEMFKKFQQQRAEARRH